MITKFEEWASSKGFNLERSPVSSHSFYQDPITHAAFEGYNEGIRESQKEWKNREALLRTLSEEGQVLVLHLWAKKSLSEIAALKQTSLDAVEALYKSASAPRYVHRDYSDGVLKVVTAFMIKAIEHHDNGATITPAEKGFDTIEVDAENVRKHNPQVCGYWLKYDDGRQIFLGCQDFNMRSAGPGRHNFTMTPAGPTPTTL